MRAFKFTVISVACAWLFWNVFAAVFLNHASGKYGYGGFHVADRQMLYDYLTSRGFTRVPVVKPLDTTRPHETFRGSSDGSRPFLVTILTRTNEDYGVYVETTYEYSGFTSSVDDSTRKARAFSDSLHQWLTEQRMRRLSPRL